RDYPEHIKPLACAMPLNPFSGKNKLALTAASWIYRALAAAEGHEVGKIAFLDPSQTRDLLPLLAPAAKHGVFTWTDAQVPEVQVFNNVLRNEAVESGVVLLEDTRVTKIQRTSLGFSVGIQSSEDSSQLSSRCVINSSGPWIDSIEVNGVPEFSPPARLWCRAFNIVLTRKIESTHAIGVPTPQGRLLFLVQRNTSSAIGTWYLKLNSTADSAQISEHEVSAALQEMNSCLPDLNLSFDDVSNIECGVLPVKRYVLERPVLFGSERIECRHGYLDLTSTKYTTFRTQAKRVVSQLDPFFSKQVGIVAEHKSGTKEADSLT
ncbi:MAG: FAD-dependent oxidoreductase, partial [Bdellovibrionales bacterium]|nr:FAD-dependent oxidoreductase [Bdellovibrionales bacterium]